MFLDLLPSRGRWRISEGFDSSADADRVTLLGGVDSESTAWERVVGAIRRCRVVCR
jgi:hypothetical protein